MQTALLCPRCPFRPVANRQTSQARNRCGAVATQVLSECQRYDLAVGPAGEADTSVDRRHQRRYQPRIQGRFSSETTFSRCRGSSDVCILVSLWFRQALDQLAQNTRHLVPHVLEGLRRLVGGRTKFRGAERPEQTSPCPARLRCCCGWAHKSYGSTDAVY